MDIHRVRIPAAPLACVNHVEGDIVVERHHCAVFVDEDIFSSLEDTETLLTCRKLPAFVSVE
jgi:hypothetical protein